jgi:hypothetical protein
MSADKTPLQKARARHTNALLNARSRDQIGDLAELSAAGRDLARLEREAAAAKKENAK